MKSLSCSSPICHTPAFTQNHLYKVGWSENVLQNLKTLVPPKPIFGLEILLKAGVWHMGEEHDKDFISYFETDFPCSVCDRWCRSDKELNRHMKIYHCKRVKFCSFDCKSCDEDVVEGKNPPVGTVQDMDIDESASKTNPQKGKKSRVECNFCDQTFKSRNQLMIHKKQEHTEKVSVCWNFLHGNCRFGDSSCWFRHTRSFRSLQNL